jgi:hypothetical protein
MLSGWGFEGFADAKNGGAKKMNGAPATALGKAGANAAGGSLGGMDNKKQAVAGFASGPASGSGAMPMAAAPAAGAVKESFADFQGSPFGGADTLSPLPMAAGQKPQGCYPREQLNPSELLPADMNSQWAQVNPSGAGDIQGKNFLSAGALIGVNTIGQSLRNANLQLRAEPPNPQPGPGGVGPWLNSTIAPDLLRRPLE